MTELKSCPFCGHEPQVSSYEYHLPSGKVYATQWRVECMDDLCPTQPTADWHYFTREEAIDAWNTRAVRTATRVKVPLKGHTSIGHYECGDCRGVVGAQDAYCKHCGVRLVDS